jgi:hypothetical protein
LHGKDYDACTELALLLEEAGLTLDFDPGRNTQHACTFCGLYANTYKRLEQIGTYFDGTPLKRPVCIDCFKNLDVLRRRKDTGGACGR